jgi:hypothetical protein
MSEAPPAAPPPAPEQPAVKNRGGLALVVGLAIVGLGVYVLQPTQQAAPQPPPGQTNAPVPGKAAFSQAIMANRTPLKLTPQQIEAIRAARTGRPPIPTMGPDGQPSQAPAAPGAESPEVQAAVRAIQPGVNDCYQQGLKQKADLGGTVTVAFTLHKDPQGGSFAKEGAVADSSLQAPQVEGCIVQQLNQARFPDIKGEGDVQVRYPFKLEPPGEGQPR